MEAASLCQSCVRQGSVTFCCDKPAGHEGVHQNGPSDAAWGGAHNITVTWEVDVTP